MILRTHNGTILNLPLGDIRIITPIKGVNGEIKLLTDNKALRTIDQCYDVTLVNRTITINNNDLDREDLIQAFYEYHEGIHAKENKR